MDIRLRFPKFNRLRLLAAVSSCTLVAALSPVVANAQTATALTLSIAPDIPANGALNSLPTNTGQRVIITVTNTGAVALTNQQIVVRIGQKPDAITAVNDGTGAVGLIDANTGAWYHTIAQLAPSAKVSYAVTSFKVCPGRWPIAARVADKVSVLSAIWVGNADARCVADEATNPAPASYYALAWPGAVAQTATSTTVAGATALAGATTTTIVGGVVGGAVTTTTLAPGVRPSLINLTLVSTTTTPTTLPLLTTSTTLKPGAASGTTTTAIPGTGTTVPGLPTTTVVGEVPSSTKVPSTKAPIGPTTTTIIFCKTVGAKRYCAAKYSIYKDGQKKVKEVSATAKNKQAASSSKKKKKN